MASRVRVKGTKSVADYACIHKREGVYSTTIRPKGAK